MTNEENLLFGIFALDMRRVAHDVLIRAAERWAADPSKSLPVYLHEDFEMTQRDREFVEAAVRKAIDLYGGNPADALDGFGGGAQIFESYRGSIQLLEGGQVTSRIEHPLPAGDPVESPEDFLVGPRDRYSEINLLGSGGMGRVLLVLDGNLDRRVALKELHIHGLRGRAPDPEFVARFIREASITGLLEHPSITPIYDIGRREDGAFFYTMKFVKGATLDQAIHEAGNLKARLALLPHYIDLCQAIAFSHSKGIIHRDIKPSNVVLGDYGETMVIDWGLAKDTRGEDTGEHAESPAAAKTGAAAGDGINRGDETVLAPSGLSGGGVHTMAGNILGTPMYMAPEQAAGDVARVDERSDVYALGVVLYQLLTGTTPYSARAMIDVLRSTIHEQPRPISSLERQAPKYLADIANKAMAKAPEDRFESAKDMVESVQAYVPKQPASRLKKTLLLTTAVLAVLVPIAIIIANSVTDKMINAKNAMIREMGLPTNMQELAYPMGALSEDIPQENLPSPLGMLGTLNLQYPVIYRQDDGFVGRDATEFYDKIREASSMLRPPAEAIDSEAADRFRATLDDYSVILDKVHEILALPPEHFGKLLIPVFGQSIPEDPLKTDDTTFASILEATQALIEMEFLLARAEGRQDESALAVASLIDLIHHLRAWPWPASQEHAARVSAEVFDLIHWLLSQEDVHLSPATVSLYQSKLRGARSENPLGTTFQLMALRSHRAFAVLDEGRSVEVMQDLKQDPYSMAMMAAALYSTSPLRFWRNLDELKCIDAAAPLVDLARRPYHDVRGETIEIDALFRRLSRRRLRYPVTSWIAQAMPEDRYPGALIREQASHKARFSLIDTAFALYSYKRIHGEYPPRLETLVPASLPNVPDDGFSGEALRYRRQVEGYSLYSVGPDGVDGGGEGDDITWTMLK